MNLLIYGYRDKDDSIVIDKIIEELNVDKFVLITELEKKDIKCIPSLFLDLQNLFMCEINIRNIGINEFEFKALDSKFLEKLSHGQLIYLEIIERIGYLQGRTITFEERLEIFYQQAKLLNGILDKYEIDVCIFDFLPHSISYLLYEICKIKDIKTITSWTLPVIPNKFVGRYFFEDIFDQFPTLKQEFEELKACTNNLDIVLNNNLELIINEYTKSKSEIVPLIYLDPLQSNFIRLINKMIYALKLINSGDKWAKYRLPQYIKKTIKLKKIYRYYDKIAVIFENKWKYIYLPLHYQPECTSLPMGKHFSNQFLMIDMLSKALPNDMKLLVKAHPVGGPYLTKEFFRKISECRNTYLVSRDTNTYDLIDNSVAIATITGTAGWEGLVRGKPVFMFGYYFYQYAPGVFHIKNNEDLINAFEVIMKGNYKINNKDLLIFLKALEPYIIDGYMDPDYASVSNISKSENAIITANTLLKIIRKWGIE